MPYRSSPDRTTSLVALLACLWEWLLADDGQGLTEYALLLLLVVVVVVGALQFFGISLSAYWTGLGDSLPGR